jgi:hypothetical protein
VQTAHSIAKTQNPAKYAQKLYTSEKDTLWLTISSLARTVLYIEIKQNKNHIHVAQ